jgi:hypothetical protein
MKAVYWSYIAVLLMLPVAGAANARAGAGDIAQEPICFGVRNEAPLTRSSGISGRIITVAEDGTIARHRSNFRLDASRGRWTRRAIRRTGPNSAPTARFIRTGSWRWCCGALVPVFELHDASIDQGEIVIKGRAKTRGRRGDVGGVFRITVFVFWPANFGLLRFRFSNTTTYSAMRFSQTAIFGTKYFNCAF